MSSFDPAYSRTEALVQWFPFGSYFCVTAWYLGALCCLNLCHLVLLPIERLLKLNHFFTGFGVSFLSLSSYI